MNLGHIRSEFGNLPDEHEMVFEIDGKPVRITEVTREKIVGETEKAPAKKTTT